MFVLQTALPPSLPVIGTRPDFLLITLLIIGLLNGRRFGVGVGLAAGLLQDLFLGGMFGIYTIAKSLIGGLAGFLDGKIYKENFILPPLIIFLATLVHELLIILLSRELLFRINFLYSLQNIILPGALVNALVGTVIYFIFYRVEGKSN